MLVAAQRRARTVALRHPACPGLSDGIVRSAQQEDNLGSKARYLSFTRLERRKSLMERLSFVSCCGAQVKAMTWHRSRSCSIGEPRVSVTGKGRPCAASALGGGRLTERAALERCQAHRGGGRPAGALAQARTPSHAIDRGATLAEVQATLGHSNIMTTSGYRHARPESSSRQLSYKTRILIAVRSNGMMTVIADWPHLPKQAEVQGKK
jgi:hypothetical protein